MTFVKGQPAPRWQRGGTYPGLTPIKGENGAAARLGVHFNTVKELLAARGLAPVYRRAVAYVKDQHLVLLEKDRHKSALPNECTILEAADILFPRSDELKELEKKRLGFLRRGTWPPPKVEKRYQELLHKHYGKAHHLVKIGKLKTIRDNANGDHTRMVFYHTHLEDRLIEAEKRWACILLDRNSVYDFKQKMPRPKNSTLPAHYKNETEIAGELGVPEEEVHGPLTKIRKKHQDTDGPIAQIGHHTDSLGRMQPRWYWDWKRTRPELELAKTEAQTARDEDGRKRILDALRRLNAYPEGATHHEVTSEAQMKNTRVVRLVSDLEKAGCIRIGKVLRPAGKWGGKREWDGIWLAEAPPQPAQQVGGAASRPTATVAATLEGTLPRWDADRRELHVGSWCYRFRMPPLNQGIILAWFHDNDWDARVPDPFHPRDILKQTLKDLNRTLREKESPIEFHQAKNEVFWTHRREIS